MLGTFKPSLGTEKYMRELVGLITKAMLVLVEKPTAWLLEEGGAPWVRRCCTSACKNIPATSKICESGLGVVD